MAATNTNAINYFSPAKYVVSKVVGEGTHSTIASALTSASSGDTIIIMPASAYAENLTLKAGVNLCAYGSDSGLTVSSNVIIQGKATFTGAGTVTISGVQLQTNSDYLLAVTGSAASIVNLNNCYLNCLNNTGIDFTSTGAGTAINVDYCTGDLGTTGIGFHTMPSTAVGTLTYNFCNFTNSGASLTASTNAASVVNIFHSIFASIFSTSSTGSIGLYYVYVTVGAINQIALTTAGTGIGVVQFCQFTCGTASTISVGTGTTVTATNSYMSSSNTHNITGAGTLLIEGAIIAGTQNTNVTTQTGGAASGLTQGTAPSAGFIGEQISSATSGSTSNASPANVTSIALTAGIWDVSCLANGQFTGAATFFALGISSNTGSFTGTVAGSSSLSINLTASGPSYCITIPQFRITLSSSVTYYLVTQTNFSTGACTVAGRITATRVG